MVKGRWFLPVVVFCLFLPLAAVGQQPIHWEATIDSARQAANQSNRLVLVFFCAGYCAPCHRLENELRNQPGAVTAMEAKFVPVKISSEYYPNTAKQYGVTRIPTTVILAPNGNVLASFAEYMPPDQYLANLNKIAADSKHPVAFAQIPASPQVGNSAGPGPSPAAGSMPPVAQPAAQPAAQPGSGAQIGGNIGPPGLQPGGPVAGAAAAPVAQPHAVPSESQSPPDGMGARPNPLLGLDGFCPVQLVENSQWQPGKRAWGAVHRGRTYLFSGLEERNRFLANPDRYAPVSSGDDVVLLLDQGHSVPGHREHGLQFEGHVYLFASEVTLERFHSNPHYYADRALQAIRSTAQAAVTH
jgi:YHS domain-containing protein/thioredoxin-related protein